MRIALRLIIFLLLGLGQVIWAQEHSWVTPTLRERLTKIGWVKGQEPLKGAFIRFSPTPQEGTDEAKEGGGAEAILVIPDENDTIDSAQELVDEIVLDEGESFILLNFASIVGEINSAFPVSTSGDEGALVVRDVKIGRAFGDLRVEGGIISIDFYHRPDVDDEETIGGLYGGTGVIGGVFHDFKFAEDSNKSFYIGSNTIGIKTGEHWETTTQVEGGMVMGITDDVYIRLGNFLNTNVNRINWTWVGQSEISALVGRPSILGGPTQFRVGLEAIWINEITGGPTYPRYIFKFNLNRQGKFSFFTWW